MRDRARIDRIMDMLRHIWNACPDQRLGQLVSNLLTDERHHDVWSPDDDVAERKLRAFLSGGFDAARRTR